MTKTLKEVVKKHLDHDGIDSENLGTCEVCGRKANTRPWGPNGEHICPSCFLNEDDNPSRTEGESS